MAGRTKVAKARTSEAIKVGVIGYGGAFNMGRRHLEWVQAAGMRPTAVCEIDPERLAIATQDFPDIETYSSVAAMLKRSAVELIVIITPHNTHAKLALQCLRAGRHVVCEKPMAITTAECDRMIAMADKQGLVLSTFHNRHWDGCVVEALEAIHAKKRIGSVRRIRASMGGWGQPGDWWRSSKSISGGVFYDWGVHFLEYALQIVDDEITEVTAFATQGNWQTRWGTDSNEDEGTIIVRFAGGVFLELRITTRDPDPEPWWFQITGTTGTWKFDARRWECVSPKGRGKKQRLVRESGNNRPDAWQQYYANLAAHLAGDVELVIDARWSRRPIHILDLACRSIAQGKALKARYR